MARRQRATTTTPTLGTTTPGTKQPLRSQGGLPYDRMRALQALLEHKRQSFMAPEADRHRHGHITKQHRTDTWTGCEQ